MPDPKDPDMSAVDVLVIIVNYNGGELLAQAVGALKRQTFNSYRLIVVDNASTNDSIGLMKASNPDTEVLVVGSNLGFAAANNFAVKCFPGSSWIALLNPDAFPEPGWLQTLVDTARNRSDVASFASRTIDASDATLLDGAGDACHISGRYWRRGHKCAASNHYLQ